VKSAWDSELERIAAAHIRAKFRGRFPESITPRECVELMLDFSAFESQRSKAYKNTLESFINTHPMPPIIVRRG